MRINYEAPNPKCRIVNLLSTHTIPSTYRKRLEGLLIILIETFLVSRIIFWQKSLRMKDLRLDPIIGIVLDILQIYTDNVLDLGQRSLILYKYSLEADTREEFTNPSRYPVTINHLTFWRNNSGEIDRRGMMNSQGFVDDSPKIW